ncbi:hypothetical protein [Streptomyces sp. CT34]|nr:hypothetical protein [Streptomyces sp. CT34]
MPNPCATCNGTGLVPNPNCPGEVVICPDCSGGYDPEDYYSADIDW